MTMPSLPSTLTSSPAGFQFFRIGDAVAARNTHAAIYNALRLVMDIQNGLMISTPVGAKWRTLRVTMVAPCPKAVAAIIRS
jgi:hypothetical protein